MEIHLREGGLVSSEEMISWHLCMEVLTNLMKDFCVVVCGLNF